MKLLKCALALLSLALAAPSHAAPSHVTPPKLIIAIAVDQFGENLFERYRASYTGGLRRLADGATFTGFQSHAATETCPGHSTILTGDHPARTGIVANTWFDRASGFGRYCAGVPGSADPGARGPQNLRVDTLGDWLKAAKPGARVYAISGKDRAAIMMGGHHADGVYWWNDAAGFGSSSFAGPVTPQAMEAVTAFNADLFAAWAKAPPVLWPTQDFSPVCAALVKSYRYGDMELSGDVPPDTAKHVEDGPDYMKSSAFWVQVRSAPTFDPMTLDLATALVDAKHLGKGPATDLLAISLSTTDLIGHRYGQGGAEMCAQVHALDRSLGAFFGHIDALKIPYVVVLTADHGGSDAPERAGPPATRIDGRRMVAELNTFLKLALKLNSDPIGTEDPRTLWIKTGMSDLALKTQVQDLALAWLNARREVSHAYAAAEIAVAVPSKGKAPADLSQVERFHESFDADRSGDIEVAFVEGGTLSVPVHPGDTIASHGSPWDYDRRVPILFWWPGVKAAKGAAAIETVDIAPTLAALVPLKAPPVDGRCVDLGGNCAPP